MEEQLFVFLSISSLLCFPWKQKYDGRSPSSHVWPWGDLNKGWKSCARVVELGQVNSHLPIHRVDHMLWLTGLKLLTFWIEGAKVLMTTKLAILVLGFPPRFLSHKTENLLSCLSHILQFPNETHPNWYTHLNRRRLYLLRDILKEIKWYTVLPGAGQASPWQPINWCLLTEHSSGWSFFSGKQLCY